MNINVEHLRNQHMESVCDVLAVAFKGPREKYINELQTYRSLQADCWLAASVDDHPVGVVGGIDYGSFTSIGYMAVDPAMQGKGVAKKLFERLLEVINFRQCQVVVLDATDAGAPLYRQFGFIDDGTTLEYECTDEAKIRGNLVSSATEVSNPDIDDIERLDQRVFGADRASVLEHYLNENPNRAFVTRDQVGNVTGYVIAQSKRIGPWVTTNQKDAAVLLEAALSLNFDGSPRVDIPDVNGQGVALLQSYGFTLYRTFQHMTVGTQPGDRTCQYGQTNLTLG